ncbi:MULTISPECIES: YesL family protein [Bacillaceae]|uniref:YesL family protein n=1 Tax=Bacillaceae TaxID=186817 RepID=UPI0004B8B133|nr:MULTISPECIES: YesL family protein [Bacillaceae]MCM3440483.1 YesL family protein [Metabacillus halosaccharovorans]
METSGWTGGIYRICDWISKLAYVNLLWMFFTLAGLILFGIAPSTVALFTIIRKWMMGEHNISIFSSFWDVYKREFKKANILLGSLLVVIAFMYIDLVLIQAMQGLLHYIFLTCFVIMSIILTIIFLYIFPVYVHFEGSILHYYKSSILLGTSFPLRTFMMVLAVGTGLFISLLFPGVAFLFLGSGIAFALTYFSYSIFPKMSPGVDV